MPSHTIHFSFVCILLGCGYAVDVATNGNARVAGRTPETVNSDLRVLAILTAIAHVCNGKAGLPNQGHDMPHRGVDTSNCQQLRLIY